LIFIIILQQIDGNIIGPAIIGDSTGLSAFWVIFSILGGGGLFGLVGMLIGVPTFAVIYYIIRTYIEYRLTSKELKSASQDYEDLDRINKENGITVYKHLSS
jgi:predicted PurR-regulated permease PerM